MKKLILLSFAMMLGCMNPNTGSNTIVGESMILPEVSDSADSVSVRIFKSLKGSLVWVAKDSNVEIEYDNNYSNTYFGCFYSNNKLKLKVKISPVSTNVTSKVK